MAGGSSLTHLSDDEIIERVKRGDRECYVALFDRYYARVYRFARWQLKDGEAASDIASETFVRAYASVHTYRTGENLPYAGYLLQICRRLIYAEAQRPRYRASRSVADVDAEVRKLLDTCELPLDVALQEERREMIRQAVQKLPPSDREIILLAFERDLSRRDIAILMGKSSITAVTSHLHRAMQKLRTVILRQGYFSALDDARGP